MQYSQILANIHKHIPLEKHEADYFTSLLTVRTIKRKESLLQAGDNCPVITYVQAGALRAYYSDDKGNESMIMFALQDWWVTDMHAFALEKPAMLNIDALEESTIMELKKSDLDILYTTLPKFERFFRIIMQNAYIREQLRVIENLSKPAEERYQSFVKKYPLVMERIPLKQIASYLGITPEFLSVIRKNMLKK